MKMISTWYGQIMTEMPKKKVCKAYRQLLKVLIQKNKNYYDIFIAINLSLNNKKDIIKAIEKIDELIKLSDGYIIKNPYNG